MIQRLYLTTLLALACICPLKAQVLKPGFDAKEYMEMLSISAKHVDSIWEVLIPPPASYYHVYRSPETGLRNCWDLWVNYEQSAMAVSLRGTIANSESWLENFYAAMVPAVGVIKYNDSSSYSYKLAEDPKAMVHVGWLLGVMSMAPDIVAHIKEQYARGNRQVIVIGHSQGGAMAYFLHSYLYYQVKEGKLPVDLVIKTYCSAAPKPGNLYYAYDFDFITRGGWAFTVLNAADWVPETPFSLQTLDDFNPVNPFTDFNKKVKKQPLLARAYIKHAYKKLDGSSRKSQKIFRRYLGTTASKQVKKIMPGFVPPPYVTTMNYMRAGTPIILQPDSDYYLKYPNNTDKVFLHHGFDPYYLMTQRIYLGK